MNTHDAVTTSVTFDLWDTLNLLLCCNFVLLLLELAPLYLTFTTVYKLCCAYEGAVSAGFGVLTTSRTFRRSLLAFVLASLVVMLGAWGSSVVSTVESSCVVVDDDGDVLIVDVVVTVGVSVGMLCINPPYTGNSLRVAFTLHFNSAWLRIH